MEITPHAMRMRIAVPDDTNVLHDLIEKSVRRLASEYTSAQIEGALGNVLGLDSQLIADQTYFVCETQNDHSVVVGCGGWSMRKTLFGSDHFSKRESTLLDPSRDPAKIRAVFVHPDWARRGIGSMILKHCEDAAIAAGFHHFEMASTLTGVPLYKLKGYQESGRIELPLPNGEVLPVIHMTKTGTAG